MPYHQSAPLQTPADRDDLVGELVGELREPRPFGQPIILDDHTPETNSRRLHVIWDRWESCPRPIRSDVITGAFRRVFGWGRSDPQITLALGVTVPEAAGIGLVPFEVAPVLAKGVPVPETHRAAMISAGASTLFRGERPVLRCARLEDAQATIDFLQEQLPGSRWTVIREVATDLD